jgi:hypothetical protein
MNNFYDSLHDKAFSAVDYFRYYILGQKIEVPDVPKQIQIRIHREKEFTWIESPEYPGLFASGSDDLELWKCLNDSIPSYFGVPRYLAKKVGNIYYLPLPDGTVIIERPKEEYARAGG